MEAKRSEYIQKQNLHEQNKQKLLLEQKRKQADRRAQIEARERKAAQQQQAAQQELTGTFRKIFEKIIKILEQMSRLAPKPAPRLSQGPIIQVRHSPSSSNHSTPFGSLGNSVERVKVSNHSRQSSGQEKGHKASKSHSFNLTFQP